MFLIASENHRRSDEILRLIMRDIEVYPKGTNIIFCLTSLCFSITFTVEMALCS